ncbi:MAG: agmatinase [Candidatus Gastranaerophilales bacterium]|nr:agmatinase [Candidatus Gastranaerophilales bacterium]
MLNKNVVNYMACDAEYEDANVVLYGAPFDSTTSFRPGTRFASNAIRTESYGLETYSPYQDKDLTDCKIFDSGDLELAIGNSELVLDEIEKRAEQILKDGKIPFMIGGEHLVTLGAMRAVVKKYPDVHIIHFDAHTDLREDYLGVKLSHACVIKRCWELVGDGKIFQFGIRSGEKQEFLWAKSGHTFLNPFNFDGLDKIIKQIKGKNVYFTLDLDVLDPSVFCGTGTPEPGGVSFLELMRAATKVCSELNIIGCDVNELSPAYDNSGASTAVACKIIREMLLSISLKGE